MLELLNQFIPNIMDKLPDFWTAILETFIMLGIVGVTVSYTHLDVYKRQGGCKACRIS